MRPSNLQKLQTTGLKYCMRIQFNFCLFNYGKHFYIQVENIVSIKVLKYICCLCIYFLKLFLIHWRNILGPQQKVCIYIYHEASCRSRTWCYFPCFGFFLFFFCLFCEFVNFVQLNAVHFLKESNWCCVNLYMSFMLSVFM